MTTTPPITRKSTKGQRMPWFSTYVRIAFQLHAALERTGEMYFVDSYYGPGEWRTEEPPADLRETLREIDELRQTLSTFTNDPSRIAYLETQLRSLTLVCRYLLQEPITLREAAREFMDMEPAAVPDAVLDENRRMYADALGGTGTIAERLARFNEQILIPPTEHTRLHTIFEEILAETRTRTRAILPLPDTEGVDTEIVTNVFYGGANWYKGNYRSHMAINADRPMSLLRLLLLACHEGYPGHHTEAALKEKFIYRDKGYEEQSLLFIGPQIVVNEGIATLAGSMIFPPAEAAAWLTDAYRAFNISFDGVDLPLLMEAFWAVDPDSLGTNVVLRHDAGESLEEATAYALQYGVNSEAEIRRFVTDTYGSSLLRRVYQLSYYNGRHLMQPLLQGHDRFEVWRRFHTEPITPAMLRNWS